MIHAAKNPQDSTSMGSCFCFAPHQLCCGCWGGSLSGVEHAARQGERIGAGGFGFVYRAASKASGQHVAVKDGANPDVFRWTWPSRSVC